MIRCLRGIAGVMLRAIFNLLLGRPAAFSKRSAFELIEDESACLVPGHVRLFFALVSVRRMRTKKLSLVAKTLLLEAAPMTRS